MSLDDDGVSLEEGRASQPGVGVGRVVVGARQTGHLEGGRDPEEGALGLVESAEAAGPAEGNAASGSRDAVEGRVGVGIEREDLEAEVEVATGRR